jgi:hypothetical protein
MKYYLLNKDEVKKNIWTNPILVKTKSFSKLEKIRKMKKQIEVLTKQVVKELKESNVINDERIEMMFKGENLTEISLKDYNALIVMGLYDKQEQRIHACNRTGVLQGKLYGDSII